MHRFMSALVLTVLAGCTNPQTPPADDPAPETFTEITFSGKTATPEERAQCETVGGEVRPAGKAQFDMCVQAYPDAGKICSDASDCLGRCVLDNADATLARGTAITGVCEADNIRFGCTPLVNGGLFEGTLCVD